MERLLQRWRSHQAPMRPGVHPEDLDAFEAKHGVLLPDDMRVFYSLCDGLDGWPADQDDFRSMVEFWPLARLEPWTLLGEDGKPTSYFIFADWLISSLVFSIRLTADLGVSNLVVQDHYTELANSFSEFVVLYLERPNDLLTGRIRPNDLLTGRIRPTSRQ